MIRLTDKTRCSGCYACADVCECNAIKMVSDTEGFWYPEIKSHCSNCGACEDVCPIINKPVSKESSLKAYAVYNRDENVRLQSSSGGIFTLLAESVISKGGVVFGASFDDDFKQLKHIVVESLEELYKLQGSKYLQSNIGESYSIAKKYLDDGKKVLFTGTPCQINGLVKFLGREYDNLFLQDLICHGVPSPLFWNKYTSYIEENAKATIKNINFRNKNNGWTKYSLTFDFGPDNQISTVFDKNKYMIVFLKDLCLRPSCYNCSFKGLNRYSDVTLGDFWGVEQMLPHLNDDKGVSLVLINSDKGQKLFAEISESCHIEEVNAERAVACNPMAIESVKMKKQRDSFFVDLQKQPLENVLKKYGKSSKVKKVLGLCFSIVNKVLK